MLKEFIAHLEARAPTIGASQEYPQESFDFCSECKAPLPKYREIIRRIGLKEYCHVCADIREAVAVRQFFVNTQSEFERHQKRVNILRPDSDYLDGAK